MTHTCRTRSNYFDGNPDCPCGPTPELVKRFLRRDGWLYVHHSLDGREHREENPNA